MLLQLENANQDTVNRLLAFARQNHIELSFVDDAGADYSLTGKPLTPQQLTQLIEKSRKAD